MEEDKKQEILNPDASNKGMDAFDPLQIAKYYTNGDIEKARNMLTGEYTDVYAFKIRISAIDTFAACLIFYNHIYNKIIDISGIISKSYDVEDIKVSDPWLDFESKIVTCIEKNEHDNRELINMLHLVQEHFTEQFAADLTGLVSLKDHKKIVSYFERHIVNLLPIETMHLFVEFEETSSLKLELESKTKVKLKAEEILNGSFEETQEQGRQTEAIDLSDIQPEKNGFDESKVKEVFNGELILAPTHGMHISGLVVKDKIKIRLTDTSNKAIMIAKAFNAYKNDKMGPIVGEVVSFRSKRDNGYKLFVEIADGIYVRIEEDEKNIKVEFVSPSPDRDQKLQHGIAEYVDKHVDIVEKDKRKKAKKMRSGIKTDTVVSSTSAGFMIFVVILILMVVGIIYFLLS